MLLLAMVMSSVAWADSFSFECFNDQTSGKESRIYGWQDLKEISPGFVTIKVFVETQPFNLEHKVKPVTQEMITKISEGEFAELQASGAGILVLSNYQSKETLAGTENAFLLSLTKEGARLAIRGDVYRFGCR